MRAGIVSSWVAVAAMLSLVTCPGCDFAESDGGAGGGAAGGSGSGDSGISGSYDVVVNYVPARLTLDEQAGGAVNAQFEWLANSAGATDPVLVESWLSGDGSVSVVMTFPNGVVISLHGNVWGDTISGDTTTSAAGAATPLTGTFSGTRTGQSSQTDDSGQAGYRWDGTVKGTWSGTFIGRPVDGTFTMVIGHSYFVSIAYEGDAVGSTEGAVSDEGELAPLYSAGAGEVSWNGTFRRGSACTGTWSTDGGFGTWTGTYQ